MSSVRWRWGLAALSAATLGLGLQSNYHLNHAARKSEQREDCLAAYNVAVAERGKITSGLADQQNATTNDAIQGMGAAVDKLLDPTLPPAKKVKAAGELQQVFVTAKQRAAAIAKMRAEHPPPDLPPDCRRATQH